MLRDARWIAKRKEIKAKQNYTCQVCGVKHPPGNLQVHHKTYRWDSVNNQSVHPADYLDSELDTLCYECHPIAEGVIKDIKSDSTRVVRALYNTAVKQHEMQNDIQFLTTRNKLLVKRIAELERMVGVRNN